MKYTFKELDLSEPERLWLTEVFKSDFTKIDVKVLKVKLWGKLPIDFEPDKIDNRLIRQGHLTLIGIWHIDPENKIFDQVKKIIHSIQKLILDSPNVKRLPAYEVAKIASLDVKEAEIGLRLIYEIGGFFQGAVQSDENSGFKIVDFSDHDNAYDAFLKFKSIESNMEQFFISQASYTARNSSNPVLVKPHELNVGKTHQLDQPMFVDQNRITELKSITDSRFDLSRLIQLCIELNVCYSNQCYISCAMLTRSITDHVPPIFESKNFSEVVNNYQGSKSFKESMRNLDMSSRKIADSHLHTQIRSKEVLPTRVQVDFSHDMDVLLSEIIRILK